MTIPGRARWRVAAALAAALVAGACDGETQAQAPVATETLIVETASGARHAFRVEVADEPAERTQGLMFRTEMAADAGMLFEYPAPQTITMWMRNTYLPLDMLFIASDGRILNIAKRTVPESLQTIPSAAPAIAVLELNAGTTDRLGIAAGDRVLHAFFGSAP